MSAAGALRIARAKPRTDTMLTATPTVAWAVAR